MFPGDGSGHLWDLGLTYCLTHPHAPLDRGGGFLVDRFLRPAPRSRAPQYHRDPRAHDQESDQAAAIETPAATGSSYRARDCGPASPYWDFFTFASSLRHSPLTFCQNDSFGTFLHSSMTATVTCSVPSISRMLASGLPPLA